jgi:hypothetical protein
MNSKSIYKVPNGKLLKIFIDYNIKKNTINKINITGDFFVYPEESIEIIEKKLKNVKLEKNLLIEKINSIIKEYKIEFIGLNSEGITEGILQCLK